MYKRQANVTAGAYDLDVEVDAAAVFSSDGNTTQAGTAKQDPFIDRYVVDQTIGVSITTGGGFLPAGSNDLAVVVWLLMDYS